MLIHTVVLNSAEFQKQPSILKVWEPVDNDVDKIHYYQNNFKKKVLYLTNKSFIIFFHIF